MNETVASAIKSRIVEDMKTAMRAQDKERLATIRMILAALKQKEVDERITLTDEHVLAVLDKMIKQRRESIAQYKTGNRPDLVEQEEAEVKVILDYLPAQLTPMEIDQIIQSAIQETGAASPRDIGKVMAIVKTKAQGRADMSLVSNKVKEHLSQ